MGDWGGVLNRERISGRQGTRFGVSCRSSSPAIRRGDGGSLTWFNPILQVVLRVVRVLSLDPCNEIAPALQLQLVRNYLTKLESDTRSKIARRCYDAL